MYDYIWFFHDLALSSKDTSSHPSCPTILAKGQELSISSPKGIYFSAIHSCSVYTMCLLCKVIIWCPLLQQAFHLRAPHGAWDGQSNQLKPNWQWTGKCLVVIISDLPLPWQQSKRGWTSQKHHPSSSLRYSLTWDVMKLLHPKLFKQTNPSQLKRDRCYVYDNLAKKTINVSLLHSFVKSNISGM